MRNSLYALCLVFVLGSCTSGLIKEQYKLQAELGTYREPEDEKSVADVQECWKRDTLLVQLIDSVLVRSNDIKIGFLQLAMSKADFGYQRGLLKPAVNGIVQPSMRRFGKYTMDGVGNYDTQFSTNITRDQIIPEHLPDLQIGLQSSWELDIWGKLAKRRKASALRYLASESGQQWLITSLVAEVASSYGQLIALDKELDILKNNIEIQLPEKINNISVSIDGIGTIKYIVFNGSEADFYRFFIDNIDDKSSYSVAMAFLACAKLNDEKLFKTLKPYLANSKLTFQEFMKQAKENKVSDFKYALFSACHHIGSFNGHSFQYAKDGAENKIYLKQDAQTKKFSFAQFSLYSWIF
jgi:hypothetical protein